MTMISTCRKLAGIVFSALGLSAVLYCLFAASLTAHAGEISEMQAIRLRCEYLENPMAVESLAPRLSWVIGSETRGARQTAYRILVASSPEALARGDGNLWDSGPVKSSETIHVAYAGRPLRSRQACFWKVRVWDQNRVASEWSEPASWTMALLEPGDWQGVYIGMDPAQGNPQNPWLRKTFELPSCPRRAMAWVNALGYYELYVNGQKVDDYVLTPAMTQFSKRSFYLAHDIAPYLVEGTNCVALWLGRGWYGEGLPGVVHPGPVVRAQFDVTAEDGASLSFGTSMDWKVRPSAITCIGEVRSGRYGGETYDARLEIPGWNTAELDDSDWPQAIEIAVPNHAVTAQPAEPNRFQQRFVPQSIAPFGPSTWLVDFGTNLTGWFTIQFANLAAGNTVKLEYADRLEGEELPTFSHQDEYIARGGESESFCSRFNYHAFRYVRITGLEEAPAPESMTAWLIHTDYSISSSFACSNDLVTRTHDMVFYTLRCLSLNGYLVDCPHIERLGYGGDGQASTPTALTMFGMGPLYTAWLTHWRDCQRENGDLPHTAPNPENAGGGPYWCGFVIAAPWHVFVNYGDRRILEDMYPTMERWLAFAESYFQEGVMRPWPNTDYRNWYLGDWAQPGRREQELKYSADLVTNCFLVQCYDWMTQISKEIGRPDDSARYAEKAAALRAHTHEVFYDPTGGTYADDTQIDLAYPLLARVAPPAMRNTIMQRLEQNILVEHEGHLDVGLVGVPILTTALLDANRNDLVFSYVNQTTFPGWGHMLENGATTTWEHWDGQRSHIHNCYNSIGMWFYQALAGIRPDPTAPGFAHFVLAPQPVGDITWVKASQDTMRGPIESAWNIAEGQFQWEICVPANTSATVVLPIPDASAVLESGQPLAKSAGVRSIEAGASRVTFEVQAGRYAFSAPLIRP